MFTFMRWIATPENQAARLAVGQIADSGFGLRPNVPFNPLFLHGAAGSGKTHLVSAFASEVAHRYPNCVIEARPGNDLGALFGTDRGERGDDQEMDSRAALAHYDLLVIEDIQHLSAKHAGAV